MSSEEEEAKGTRELPKSASAEQYQFLYDPQVLLSDPNMTPSASEREADQTPTDDENNNED